MKLSLDQRRAAAGWGYRPPCKPRPPRTPCEHRMRAAIDAVLAEPLLLQLPRGVLARDLAERFGLRRAGSHRAALLAARQAQGAGVAR